MTSATDTIDTLLGKVRAEYLRRMTGGDGDLLRQVEAYTASRTGKMLRPRLLLAAAATLGEEQLLSRRTLLLATCVEMLHNASLLHDDVVDNDLLRRGQPSVNARWNNATAVLVGDYHLVSIMQLLDEVDDRDATRRINDTVRCMVEGELLQQEYANAITNAITQSHNNAINQYLRIIDGKTARLFATACALGNPAYEAFGLHYGRLFQLHDDLADGEDNPFTPRLISEEEAALAAIKKLLPVQIDIPNP